MLNKISKNAMRIHFMGVFLFGTLFYSCQDKSPDEELTLIDEPQESYLFNKHLSITDPSGQYYAELKIESNDESMLNGYMETTRIGLGFIFKENDPFPEKIIDQEGLGEKSVERYLDGINVSTLNITLPENALGYFLDIKKDFEGKRVKYDHYVTYNGGKDKHYGKVDWVEIPGETAIVYVHWQYRNSKLADWNNWGQVEFLSDQNTSMAVYYSGKYLKAICESDFQNHLVYWKQSSGDPWIGPDTPN